MEFFFCYSCGPADSFGTEKKMDETLIFINIFLLIYFEQYKCQLYKYKFPSQRVTFLPPLFAIDTAVGEK